MKLQKPKTLAKRRKQQLRQPNMTDSIDLSDIDITIDESGGTDILTLNASHSYPSFSVSGMGGGSITVPHTVSTTGTNGYMYGAGTGTTWASPNSANHGSIKVTGDAEFDGDIKLQGQSLGKLLSKIEDRLAILMDPDPARLEKFQALKKAYDNYKLMDKLCQDLPEEEDK